MMELHIVHLYPEMLNLYGDRGNLQALKMRALWRGIDVRVSEIHLDDEVDYSDADIVLLGGGPDREQKLVCQKLLETKQKLFDYVQADGVLLALCGGFPMLGNDEKRKEETVQGLGLLDINTEESGKRMSGNVVLQTDFLDRPVVGFENHAQRTYIGNHQPLGKTLCGNGNNGVDGLEGVRFKNVIGTYLHGPLLPNNPHLTDWILRAALTRKYGEVCLQPLDDQTELAANQSLVERFVKK